MTCLRNSPFLFKISRNEMFETFSTQVICKPLSSTLNSRAVEAKICTSFWIRSYF